MKIRPGFDPGRWPVLPWATALLFAACGADDSSPPPPSDGTVTVRDSAGVEIVVSHAPLWSERQTRSLTPEPVLTVGPDVGSGRFLHTVGDVERLSDGRLVVENRGSAELLVFDSTGAFLEGWGGRGEGPGEFGRMLGLFTCGGDRLVEVEPRRLTFLDEDGGLVRTASLPSEVVSPGHVVRGVARDCGSVFVTGLDETLYRPTGLGTHSHEMRAFRASLAGSEVDTLGVFRGIESLPGPRGRPGARLPFAYAANWATDGERIYYGWGNEPEITVLGSDGEVEKLIRWEARPETVTDADWAAFERDRRRRSDREPRLTSTYAAREEHPHSDTKPYFGPPNAFGSGFVPSDRGELWIRRFVRFLLRDEGRPAPATSWWVFDTDGRWLGSVETPAGFEVRSVRGDLVLGVARDELDRESVRVYRMVGPIRTLSRPRRESTGLRMNGAVRASSRKGRELPSRTLERGGEPAPGAGGCDGQAGTLVSMRSLAEQRKRYAERLERAVAELPERLATIPAVRRAILFGSWPRGRRDLLTDLDLVVILESDLPFPERSAALHRMLRLDVDADILAYTPREWEEVRHRPLLKRAEEEGVVLYERDGSA